MDKQEQFYQHFHEQINALKQQIDQIGNEPPERRREAHDRILAAISALSTEVSDAADFVPTYDQRNYAQAIKSVQDDLRQTMTKVAPRSRFQFKARGAATPGAGSGSAAGPARNDPRLSVRAPGLDESATSSPQVTSPAASALQATTEQPSKDYNAIIASSSDLIRRPSFSAAPITTITGHSAVHITLPPITQGTGVATNLDRCLLDMSRATHTTFALRDIRDSLVAMGTVNGPLHITGISRSTLLLTARQVRIHDCENVHLYLHCGSRPIIEDCKGMRFAPLPACYQGEGYDPSKNQWDQVDDFKWLKAEHSPNWSILPEEARLKDEVWQDTLSGKERPVLDVLAVVGLLQSKQS